MQQVLIIGLMGGLGSVLRYTFASIVKAQTTFQHPTVLINILGSFTIGVVSMLPMSDTWRTAVMVGLLGGFTTFSAFSLESVELMQKGMNGSAALYMSSSVVCCVLSCWLGRALIS